MSLAAEAEEPEEEAQVEEEQDVNEEAGTEDGSRGVDEEGTGGRGGGRVVDRCRVSSKARLLADAATATALGNSDGGT